MCERSKILRLNVEHYRRLLETRAVDQHAQNIIRQMLGEAEEELAEVRREQGQRKAANDRGE